MLRTPAAPLLRSVAVVARSTVARPSRPFLFATINAHRSLSTSTSSREGLKLKSTDEDVSKGTEGLHMSDTALVRGHDTPHQSDVTITGDWVLFHPVYTPEEMKAVKVNIN